MKLRDEFLMHESNGETYLVPSLHVKFSGVVRGNRTLGLILGLLKKETSESEIVSAIREQYEAPEGIVERDVHRVLDELDRIGALIA